MYCYIHLKQFCLDEGLFELIGQAVGCLTLNSLVIHYQDVQLYKLYNF